MKELEEDNFDLGYTTLKTIEHKVPKPLLYLYWIALFVAMCMIIYDLF